CLFGEDVLKQLLALAAVSFSLSLHAQSVVPDQTPHRTLVRAAHLVDVHAGRLLDAQTLVVLGDRIIAVDPTAQVQPQPGDTVIDLGDATLLPGMIDVHTHLT